jgi:aspartate carbamoyltransferase catalytic subunit
LRHLLGISDLSPSEIEDILDRAARAGAGSLKRLESAIVCLVFVSPSTRTRVGFEVAIAQLGGTGVVITETRVTGPGLPPESLEDTVRVCSGMSDVVVVRADAWEGLRAATLNARCSVVNGGDAFEHPTQALIDRYAIENLTGRPLRELHLGISGDLTMRSTRSLLLLLASSPPRKLSLFAPPGRALSAPLPASLAGRTVSPHQPDFKELDVLLLPGLPPGHGAARLDDETRERWGFSPRTARALPETAIVLSPGPIIDEIHVDCRSDDRVRVFDEADLSLFLRMGVLSWLQDQA